MTREIVKGKDPRSARDGRHRLRSRRPHSQEESGGSGVSVWAKARIPSPAPLNEIATAILGILYGKPYAEPRRSLATEVFLLKVGEFPDSWNLYDSLGEAYMNDGQEEPAITNYEKSIKLNPGNTTGKQILEQLKGK